MKSLPRKIAPNFLPFIWALTFLLLIPQSYGDKNLRKREIFKSETFDIHDHTHLTASYAVDPAEKYFLGWTVDESKKEITLKVEVATKGYVGFGLSPSGSMNGADIFIAGVNKDGSIYFGDYHGTMNGMPILDKHQDWKLHDARENATHTILIFSRLLDTCDKEDLPINGDTSRVIWAYGKYDELGYHSERGTVSANFLMPEQPFNPSDYLYYDTMHEMEMLAQDTTYWCTLHKGPKLDRKHHIVAFEESLHGPDALEYSHHIGYNICTPPDGKDPDKFFGPMMGTNGGHCYGAGADRTPFNPYCQQFLYVYAKGGVRMVFPDDVGFPIAENPNVTSYYMLEIHYDNPQSKAGVKFNAGIRTYYSPNLRKIEAGLTRFGHVTNPSILVPPNQTHFNVIGHCAPECTERLFPKEGITIFNSLLHGHLSARKLKSRHFRNGVELPVIDMDDLYDFNFQQNKPLKKFVTVLPGDQLTYECVYDSSWNKKHQAISGGFTSRDEMCESYIWYYPNLYLRECMSTYPLEQGYRDLGITKHQVEYVGGMKSIYIEEPAELKGTYIDAVSYKVNWTDKFLKEFQEKRRYGEHEISCAGITEKIKVRYPKIEKKYVAPDQCEKSSGEIITSNAVLVVLAMFVVLKN